MKEEKNETKTFNNVNRRRIKLCNIESFYGLPLVKRKKAFRQNKKNFFGKREKEKEDEGEENFLEKLTKKSLADFKSFFLTFFFKYFCLILLKKERKV